MPEMDFSLACLWRGFFLNLGFLSEFRSGSLQPLQIFAQTLTQGGITLE
jgi:hypothetical protein